MKQYKSVPFFSSFATNPDLPFALRPRRRPAFTLLRSRIIFSLCTIALVFYLVISFFHRYPTARVSDWAPKFSLLTTATSYPLSLSQIRDYERRLPQHDRSLPHPEGQNGRFIKFSNEVWALGLNNQLNNRLVMSHLAFTSNRAYVFTDVTFNDTWATAKWYPLNTFVSGPIAGGPWPPSLGNAPRAISNIFWEIVCPHERRVFLNVDAVNKEIGVDNESDGVVILDRWADKLRNMPDNCIDITYDSKHIIDYYFFGSSRSLTLFPSFSRSPLIENFRWSDVVLHTVARNIPLITHSHAAAGTPITHFSPPGTLRSVGAGTLVPPLPPKVMLEHVLALHVRRGDYGEHCENMGHFSAGYNSWNLLPSLPDRYAPGGDRDEFMRHCWPSIPDMVQRVRIVQSEHARADLRAIYILTNAKPDWIKELKKALLESGMGWERITSSRDLTYVGATEKLSNQAADMELARRAGVFIGNGFSTMTANIILFRLVSGIPAQASRFW